MNVLRAVIEAYLRAHGFTSHEHATYPGREFWAHHELGSGRTFEQVLLWQIGRESEAAKRKTAVANTYYQPQDA